MSGILLVVEKCSWRYPNKKEKQNQFKVGEFPKKTAVSFKKTKLVDVKHILIVFDEIKFTQEPT